MATFNTLGWKTNSCAPTFDAGLFMASRTSPASGPGGSSYTYIGNAIPGTAPHEPAWLISRVTVEADGSTIIEFANGNADFQHIWDDRETLSYS